MLKLTYNGGWYKKVMFCFIVELPSHWTDMGNSHVHLVSVLPGTIEYNEVINKFGIFSGNYRIVSVSFILVDFTVIH